MFAHRFPHCIERAFDLGYSQCCRWCVNAGGHLSAPTRRCASFAPLEASAINTLLLFGQCPFPFRVCVCRARDKTDAVDGGDGDCV